MSSNRTYAYYTCRKVTESCPVSATTYGYYPHRAGNLFFTSFFAILLILCLIFGIRSRTWSYTIALALGLGLETAGYAGRNLMSDNPWSSAGFQLQIICIVLGPSFIAASVYLTLKHLVLYFGPQYSLLKAKHYPIIFVGCDIGSIVLQAIGGGIAAVAGNRRDGALLHTGNGLIVAGITFQVFTMTIFGSLASIFFIRYRKAREHISSNNEPEKKISPFIFCSAITVAYAAILIRCIYRYELTTSGSPV
jgi:hypothetical protein